MALSPEAAQRAVVAYQRFGLGAKPGGLAKIAANPKAALVAEVEAKGIALISDPALPTYVDACFKAEKEGLAIPVFDQEVAARVDKHLKVPIGFVERLVIFWSNHFSVGARKANGIRGTVGQLERDVIRRHVLGRFSDMLVGVMTHPAMIVFIDNNNSVGPTSPYARDLGSKVGLNENLAREIFELHTMGTDGLPGANYTEADIREFAKVITGWSQVNGKQADRKLQGGDDSNRGQFLFRPTWHEPGAFTLLGRTYAQTGNKDQGLAVLRDVAGRRSTAEHIAFKLLRHFVMDRPPVARVDQLADVFHTSGGDLKKVALELINNIPEAWLPKLTRIRTPYELTIAQFRALETRFIDGEYSTFKRILGAMKQSVWDCRSVEGYPDETDAWLNADGMRLRLDTARLAAIVYGNRRQAAIGNVRDFAVRLYDSALSEATKSRIAPVSGKVAPPLTVLFSSPEFQRR